MTADLLQISAAEYHAVRAVSNTGISKLLTSPAHFQYWLENPDEQTEAMIIGSVFHCLALEGQEFDQRYHVMQNSRATNAGKQEEAEALLAGQTVITKSVYQIANDLATAALSDAYISRLLRSPTAQRESSIFWTEEVGGVSIPCKARLDFMDNIEKFGLLVMDLKSSKTAHPDRLPRVITERGYHRQAWWYMRALSALGLTPRKFLLGVVEKTPPHIVTPATVQPEAVEQGGSECQRALAVYAECQSKNYWPGYADQIIEVGLMPWAYQKETSDYDAEFTG